MLTEACQNPIEKTAFESVKRILRLARINAQTNRQKKIIVLGSTTLIKVPNNIFSYISSMYRHRSVTIL